MTAQDVRAKAISDRKRRLYEQRARCDNFRNDTGKCAIMRDVCRLKDIRNCSMFVPRKPSGKCEEDGHLCPMLCCPKCKGIVYDWRGV